MWVGTTVEGDAAMRGVVAATNGRSDNETMVADQKGSWGGIEVSTHSRRTSVVVAGFGPCPEIEVPGTSKRL
jgi:hypothetical protein|tara:strand:- start:572 stop:787 length:216 start_codon:yes stop_codon:yes gene_type:complete